MGRNKKLQEIDLSLNSLVVFRKLLTHEVILPLRALLDTESMDPMIQLRQYTEFISRLYARSTNLTEYIFRLICEDENFYVKAVARGEQVDEMLEACVQNELAILQRLARIRPHELQKEVSYYGVLPEWKTSDLDFGAEYHARLREIGKFGYGLFAPSPMFVIRDERIVPVLYPDPVQLSDLTGYAAERQAVTDNTLTLLRGKPAQNVLLYGDPGTGKSATVKAIVNSFFDQGLRLIQIRKEQFSMLPEIVEQIHGNPLKFILYIDDLNLAPGDADCSVLKAALDGSVSARPANAVIYAASNRRYLFRQDAEADAVLPDGTRTETDSLIGRFGLRVGFMQPGQQDYLEFTRCLADQMGLHIDAEVLAQKAEEFAARSGGRSPRAAKQLIEQLLAKAPPTD
ncbi:MAG: ATP-binding protein [Oscillospiraceae bacterium]|nr:ATP-binding protein [Oscillospiraceae bacterium]